MSSSEKQPNPSQTTAGSSGGATNEIEINEISDMIKPMPARANYDNKAFEHEDIKSREENAAAAAAGPNPFDRTQRPGSMYSLRTTGSSSSRSSVNCTTGRVRCPNLRLKKFFSYNGDNNFLKACADSKKILLPEKDGNFLGNWLLVEISTWDLHREKIVFLCEKSVIVIQYDFINGRLYNYKRIMLADLKKVKFGHLKYPEGSFMGDYEYGAVRICWGDDDKLSFIDKWNPFGDSIPFIMFTSHHILYNDKEKETEYYNCDEFIACLEFAISKLPDPSKIEIKEDNVVIENYAGLWSAWYNQNWIGFQLDRNGINF